MRITRRTVFRSAITGTDGEVDAGYLALFWLMVVIIGVIPVLCLFSYKLGGSVQDLGIAIGSVCTGFGVAVGAVGAFRMGDKAHPNQS